MKQPLQGPEPLKRQGVRAWIYPGMCVCRASRRVSGCL